MAIVEDEKIYADTLTKYIKKLEKENGYQIETTWFRDGCDITDEYDSSYEIGSFLAQCINFPLQLTYHPRFIIFW